MHLIFIMLLHQVDTETGALRLGTHTGKFQPGQVYSGGEAAGIPHINY